MNCGFAVNCTENFDDVSNCLRWSSPDAAGPGRGAAGENLRAQLRRDPVFRTVPGGANRFTCRRAFTYVRLACLVARCARANWGAGAEPRAAIIPSRTNFRVNNTRPRQDYFENNARPFDNRVKHSQVGCDGTRRVGMPI